jgi:hypothetical protein
MPSAPGGPAGEGKGPPGSGSPSEKGVTDMIEVSVEKRHGGATVRFTVIAESIERAIELAGEDAHIMFPIDPVRFFVRGEAAEGALRDPSGTPEPAAA